MERIHSGIGILALALIAWLFSEHHRRVNMRTLLSGLVLQVGLAIVLLKLPGCQALFLTLNQAVQLIEDATRAGTGFVFGYVGGGPLPFAERDRGPATFSPSAGCRWYWSSAAFFPALLLAHHSGHRGPIFPGPEGRHGDRRCGRGRHGCERVCGDGGSAPPGETLSPVCYPERAVHHYDGRHGHHRGHRDGPLCHDPRKDRPRDHGTSVDGLPDQCAGRHYRLEAHGPGDGIGLQGEGGLAQGGGQRAGCGHQRHHRRREAPHPHRGHAGGAGGSRPPPEPVAGHAAGCGRPAP